MQNLMSDTPSAASSPHPLVQRKLILPPMPQTKVDNFRKIMELGFARGNCSDLQLVIYKLYLQDTQLGGTKRYLETCAQDEYYRHLQNFTLHIMNEQVKIALIKGDYKAIVSMSNDLPEQLEPFNLPDDAPEVTDTEKRFTQPAIYTHFHVDSNGMPPTANEYLQIIEVMEGYMEQAVKVMDKVALDPQAAKAVEQFDNRKIPHNFKPDWGVAEGFLRFIQKKVHLAAARAWIDVMTSRIDDIPVVDRDVPLVGAITETGWTLEPYVRRYAHWYRIGNRLMTFIDAATQSILGPRDIRMRFVIILQILTSESAYMSEHIVSRLASSYITCTGMNTTMGGAATTSASSARGTIYEATVAKGANDLVESILFEFLRVRTSRRKLQVLVDAQIDQRELRGFMLQEPILRAAADKEQQKLVRIQDQRDKYFPEMADTVAKDLESFKAAKAMDSVVDDLVKLLETKFNGKKLD